MSLDSSVDRRKRPQTSSAVNGNVKGAVEDEKLRLRLRPNENHKPESYEDMQLEFSPLLFSSLEQYLPFNMLNLSRELKLQYMRDILFRYSPEGERARVQRHREYRQKIISNYQPLHRELYTMHAANFFLPSFLKAINENTEESFRSIMVEPSPGVYTFEMLQPHFCELLLSEVDNFERWVHETKFRIMRPNTMNKYGAVLDDFGLEPMLEKLMEDFIRPISRVFFPEVGGSTLDAHHGFVVEYGIDRDVELGFHVDDSEVTLNVCLGQQFSGGELFFRGVRCDKHVHSGTQQEEILDYSHVPGVLFCIVVGIGMVLEPQHPGSGLTYFCGAEGVTLSSLPDLRRIPFSNSAFQFLHDFNISFTVEKKSSVFRELKKYQKEFFSWCGECQREMKEKQRLAVTATKLELFKRLQKSNS